MSHNNSEPQNVGDVINEANQAATDKGIPVGIAWVQEQAMWVVYDLRDGLPEGHEAEFICFGLGFLPLPLNETAVLAWNCVVNNNSELRPAA